MTQLSSVGVPEGGIRGSGNSGTKGVFSNWDYKPEDLARYGEISRLLHRVPKEQQRVLELAYGDAGMAVTEACLYPQRRWRAIAFLSRVCCEKAAKFKRVRRAAGDERFRDVTAGPAAVHYANELLSRKEPSLADRAILRAMHEECLLMLSEAEGTFAALYGQQVAA